MVKFLYPVYKSLGVREEYREVKLLFPPQHQDFHPRFEYLMQPRPVSNNPYKKIHTSWYYPMCGFLYT